MWENPTILLIFVCFFKQTKLQYMKIPSKFHSIIESNQAFHSIVLNTITKFQPIFDDNKLFFFEEYTDHGIKHIENVLEASEFIIFDDSFKSMSAKDVAILILSVILHDIGMHIEFSTFKSLIDGKYDKYRITTLDACTWKELWTNYLTEAKRFSSKQKINIFGREDVPFVEPNLTNKDNLNGYDKKLIGEFIRRNHARFAQEVAFGGICGDEQNEINPFNTEELLDIHRQMIGILARSHGTNIRDTFDYLKEIGSDAWINPDEVNIVFLMVIIRIADYIQIDNLRTSPYSLKIKTFSSPISIKEHKSHLAIQSINFNLADREKIFVLCNPTNSEMLVKLQKLFIDIQKEFDISWAVLGEVYGFLPTNKPRIKYRRISSNLDDKLYLEKLDFVPTHNSFVVNNELSKLLVGPLYGNDPIYGVRELIQNAVDACIERNYIEKRNGNENYVPKITVSINRIDENQSKFTIVDNGKGMSLNEIQHYFLNVGTSFRSSLEWKKEFVGDDGHSFVNRNGKFGIGVLAAFLIGDNISVETNHYNENESYKFEAQINSEFIEIYKTNNEVVGTTISLIINNDLRTRLLDRDTKYEDEILFTEWYVYDFPEIVYLVDNVIQIRNKWINRSEFHFFSTKEFERIEWKYTSFKESYNSYWYLKSFIICNGIIIIKKLDSDKSFFEYNRNYPKKKYRSGTYEYYPDQVIRSKPSLIIDDKEGIFPLKLDRNDIDCIELPFEEELLVEISKKLIADVLTMKIDIKQGISEHSLIYHNLNFLYSKDGFSFSFDYFKDVLMQREYNLIRIVTAESIIPRHFLDFNSCFIYPNFKRRINLTGQDYNVGPECGGRVLLKKKNYNELFLTEKKRIMKAIKKNHVIEFQNSDFVIYNLYNYNQSTTIFKNTDYYTPEILDSIESIQEVNFDYFYSVGGKILNGLLKEYIGDNVVIPYDIEKRKKLYKKAFEELHMFMK